MRRPMAGFVAAVLMALTALLAPPGPSRAAAPAPKEFAFERLDVDTSKPNAEACLAFTRPLDASGKTRYEDYLAFTPPVQPALRVVNEKLCLAGLAFGESYRVELRAGLPAASGEKLAAAETVDVGLADRPALVAFREGLILPRDGADGLPISSINVDRIAIQVYRVPDRLVSQIERSELARRSIDDYERDQISDRYGGLVWKGELAVKGQRNTTVTTLFPLRQAVPERRPGVYVLLAADAAEPADEDEDHHRWGHTTAIQWVIDSDIGLTSFKGADGLTVFARSLGTAQPLPGVTLTLIARNNDELGRVVTDADGAARFDPGLLRGAAATEPVAVMAYGAAGDFTFQDVTRPAFDLSDRGVDGRALPGPVDAFLYSDRGIYRPRETVHLVALLRDRVARAIPDTPLTLVARRPDGVEFRRATLPDQGGGAAAWDLALTESAARGRWQVNAYLDPGADPVGHLEFEVNDFVPQRLKVELSTAATLLHPDAALHVDVAARFLYGAPAADLDGDADATIDPDPNPFPGFAEYRFGLVQEKFKEQVIPLQVATTDAEGRSVAEGTLSDIAPTTLPLKAEIRVAVQEPGGRATEERLTLPLHTRPVAIGIHPLFAGGRVAENSEASFEVVALDDAGKRIALPSARFQLVREITEYQWYKSGRSWRFETYTRDRTIDDGEVAVGGAAPAVLRRTLPWGYYRLTVLDQASGAATSLRFSAGWGDTIAEDRPDKAEVAADKPADKPGDTARIAIRPPVAGEALVVIASDRIFTTRTLHVPAEGATVEVPVSADWGSGAYAIVAQYHGLTDHGLAGAGDHVPARAIGVAWLPLDMSQRTLAVTMTPPDHVLPRQTLTLPVKVEGVVPGAKTWLTLAAVDEGILQLTHFASPSPAGYYFGKRRLAVDIRDDYGRLIAGRGEIGAIRQGGDSGAARSLEVVPTRTVALFSGLVAVDDQGRAAIPLALPDFNGELRLMAVAYDRDRVGSGEAKLTIRDPVVSDVTLPRFLAPGDRSRLSLDLHNLDGEPGLYHARFAADGAVAFPDAAQRDVDLQAGKRQLLAFALDATKPGIGTINLRLTGPEGFAVERQWQIAVRPPQLPINAQNVAELQPGQELKLDAKLTDRFLPGTASVAVSLATWHGFDVPGLLRALDRYPFGCVEQLTSRAFPLLYFNDLALLAGGRQDQDIPARVQDAIYRILDMQQESGGFGLWGILGQPADSMLGVYALDFLVQAKAKGLVVPDDALRRGRVWLRRLVDPTGDEAAARNYAAYVLAEMNAAPLADLRYLSDNAATLVNDRGQQPQPITAFARAQLGAALALAGDVARARAAFDKAETSPLKPLKDDYYGSPLRDLAGIVTLAAVARQSSLLPRLIDRFNSFDLRPESLSTQEQAWLLLAAHALSSGRGKLALELDGKPYAASGDPVTLTPDAAALGRGVTLRNAGDKAIWRTISLQGVPRELLPEISRGITLERSFWTLDGSPADLAAVHQNDRIIVSLLGKVAGSDRHDIALMDLLPAGFEIEAMVNGGDDGTSAYDFLPKIRTTRFKAALDDRFVAAFSVVAGDAGTAGNGLGNSSGGGSGDSGDTAQDETSPGYHVAYIVRAVTPGTYVLPAATAQDMYRPAVLARTATGSVTVLARK